MTRPNAPRGPRGDVASPRAGVRPNQRFLLASVAPDPRGPKTGKKFATGNACDGPDSDFDIFNLRLQKLLRLSAPILFSQRCVMTEGGPALDAKKLARGGSLAALRLYLAHSRIKGLEA